MQQLAPAGAFRIPSVMGHFLQEGVPVINFSGIRSLATQFGLPYPRKALKASVPAASTGRSPISDGWPP